MERVHADYERPKQERTLQFLLSRKAAKGFAAHTGKQSQAVGRCLGRVVGKSTENAEIPASEAKGAQRGNHLKQREEKGRWLMSMNR